MGKFSSDSCHWLLKWLKEELFSKKALDLKINDFFIGEKTNMEVCKQKVKLLYVLKKIKA